MTLIAVLLDRFRKRPGRTAVPGDSDYLPHAEVQIEHIDT